MSRILLTQPFDAFLLQNIRALLGTQSDVGSVASLELAEFAHYAQDAEVLMNLFRPINDELLQLAPRVGFVQQMTVGYNQLDLKVLARRKILAANTPGSNADAVAEHTIMLMLNLLKKYTQAEQAARANIWNTIERMRAGIGDLAVATVGLIGFGATGRAVAQRLRGFGSRLLYTASHRLDQVEEEQLGVSFASLPELLANSTIVSLHIPLNEQNQHLIGAEQIALMRSDAIVINTSRGGLIDEQALRQALLQQKIAGAGLDVLEHESAGGNIFTDLPQVIVTPHIAGASQDAFARTTRMATDNVKRFLQGKKPEHLLF